MIYVGGVPFSADDAESSSQGSTMLVALMEHPVLVSASGSVKAIPTWKFTNPEESGSEKSRQSKCVYVFQREYATVDPAYVDFVGTDEATTCVGLAIRNRTSGMTSVSHMDSPNVVDIGLTQMLNSVFNENSDAELDVHLVGGFQDVSPQQAGGGSRCKGKLEGYSFPLCAKIVETLQSRGERFHLQTLHVLGHNTRWDSAGNACPIFNGFLVETSTGSIFPASFDRTSRCPDEIVRRTRLAACFEDTNLSGRLLEVYDTQTDRFIIAPFFCSPLPSFSSPGGSLLMAEFDRHQMRWCNHCIAVVPEKEESLLPTEVKAQPLVEEDDLIIFGSFDCLWDCGRLDSVDAQLVILYRWKQVTLL